MCFKPPFQLQVCFLKAPSSFSQVCTLLLTEPPQKSPGHLQAVTPLLSLLSGKMLAKQHLEGKSSCPKKIHSSDYSQDLTGSMQGITLYYQAKFSVGLFHFWSSLLQDPSFPERLLSGKAILAKACIQITTSPFQGDKTSSHAAADYTQRQNLMRN